MSFIESPLVVSDDEALETVDVLVVGFGAAGACAALEARRRDASVLVADRFHGGGASARSGGIVYAGGGSRQQRAAGYEDDVQQMFDYLALETRGSVPEEVLRTFCERSLEDLAFLEELGVPFPPTGHAPKTSYPEDDVTLYFSGNELCPPYNEVARSAPRGHRVLGKALTGDVLFRHLRAAVEASGADVRTRMRATRLLLGEADAVVGVEFLALPESGPVAKKHARLRSLATSFGAFSARLQARMTRRLERLEAAHGRRVRIRARGGVVLAAGGFIYNREWVKQHAGAYARGMPLGTIADDGSGLELGRSVGAGLTQMSRVGAWRFINPPVPMVEGAMVDAEGQRICNEELYGSAIGAKTADQHGGRAWLVLDRGVWERVFADVKAKRKLNFQYVTALLALFVNRKKAGTIEELEERCLMPHRGLERTLADYNARARAGSADTMGKSKEHFVPLDRGPFYAVDCSFGNPWSPTPCITLGGLTVDGLTGRVKREDGSLVPGLRAAGRTAAGICSESYVSGLSLADCVFSGRNCGREAAAAAR
jgi:3-oxo-5alpha-steroid 4-dehydrogenase